MDSIMVSPPQTGAEITLIREILADNYTGSMFVRVLGVVEYLNKETKLCRICHGHSYLDVDVSIIEMADLVIDSIFYFTGHLAFSQDGKRKLLRAHMRTLANGIDLDLFESALLLRSRYIASVSRADRL